MADKAAKSGFVFTIGLTGHRDIHTDAVANARAALRNELEALRERFASLPVELVTGLAQGADTLATEVALEIGMPVRAVLPMSQALYEADFKGEAHSDLIRLLNDDRVTVQELPLPAGTVGGDYEDVASRDVLYARLMDYLVRRSNVLIALWDGEVTGLTGGSSDVVVRYLSGSEAQSPQTGMLEAISDAELADDRSELAIWIKAPRKTGGNEQSDVQTSYLVQAGAAGLVCRLPNIPDFVLERWREFDRYACERDSLTGAELTAYPISVPQDSMIA